MREGYGPSGPSNAVRGRKRFFSWLRRALIGFMDIWVIGPSKPNWLCVGQFLLLHSQRQRLSEVVYHCQSALEYQVPQLSPRRTERRKWVLGFGFLWSFSIFSSSFPLVSFSFFVKVLSFSRFAGLVPPMRRFSLITIWYQNLML